MNTYILSLKHTLQPASQLYIVNPRYMDIHSKSLFYNVELRLRSNAAEKRV